MARPVARSSFFQPKQITPTYFQAARCYSASAGLSQDEVTGRIMDLLKNFDKVRVSRSGTNAEANSCAGSGHFKGSESRKFFDAMDSLLILSIAQRRVALPQRPRS
jgi:hypothetical protein